MKTTTIVALKKSSGLIGKLPQGEYDVDALVHVTGHLRVGADYEQNIVAKANPWSLLAAALSKLNGVTVESLVLDSLNDDINLDEIKKRADVAIGAIKGATLTHCSGKVTGDIEFDEVDAMISSSKVTRKARRSHAA